MEKEKIELDWLKRWAQYSPQAIALRCADSNRSFSYRELFERSAHLANVLRERHGIRRGDRVAVVAHNEPETIFLFFAVKRLGAILVPVNYRFTAREVEHVLRDSEPSLVFCQEALSALVTGQANVVPFENLKDYIFSGTTSGPRPFDAELESPAMILYTSGTTGFPKGALITNKMLFWNSVNTGMRLSITQNDATLIFHPMFHTSGWNVLTTPFFHHGATIILLKKFDPARVLELWKKEKLTIFFGVPTMMDMIARHPDFAKTDLRATRYAVVGGEPMPVELIKVWAEKGIPVRQGYGLTEFGPNVFSLGEQDSTRKIGSIGFPNFYIDVKIIDEHGIELHEPNQIGELCLRGPACTAGYWRNEKATAESIRDGWFHTGDLVRKDEEGYFYVVGRRKEMFISGAENVYPAEVEQFLRLHDEIHEVAVVGVKDEKWGEVGKCFYSTNKAQPLADDVLKSYCLTGLAKYKIPKYFVHMDALPKSDSGKILKKNLT